MGLRHEAMSALCLLMAALPEGIAAAPLNSPSSPARRIVLLAPETQRETFINVLENTRSQMLDIPVVVRVWWVPSLPRDLEAREALSMTALIETGSELVFWCDLQAKEAVYFLYYDSQGMIQRMERRLGGSGEEGVVDAISLMTRTTVETLFYGGRSPSPAEERPVSGAPPPLEPPEEPVAGESQNAAEIEDFLPAAPMVRLSMDLAYSLRWVTRTPAFANGGRFSVQLHLGAVFRIALGTELSTPVESRSPDAGLERIRFPGCLFISAMTPLGDWRLGGGIGAFFAAMRNTPKALDDSVTVEPTFTRFAFSVEILLRVEYVFIEYLSVFLGTGVEVFPEQVTYRVENGPTLFNEALSVQPKLIVGMVLTMI